MKCSEFLRLLLEDGWYPVSQKGSHVKLRHDNKASQMTMKNKIVLILEKTETGFSAYADDYPIYTTGKSISELLDNAYEATNMYFEEENIKLLPDNIKFEVDFKQFFQYYRVLNSKFLAQRIGMNPTLLSQYVQGKKKPSDNQRDKILFGIHKIGQELSEINLIQR